MSKILIIDKKEEEISYVAILTKNKVKLRRSKSEIWADSAKGEYIGALKDTGNGIEISLGSQELNLDYSEFVELYHLVALKYKTDKNL